MRFFGYLKYFFKEFILLNKIQALVIRVVEGIFNLYKEELESKWERIYIMGQ